MNYLTYLKNRRAKTIREMRNAAHEGNWAVYEKLLDLINELDQDIMIEGLFEG